jgi:hypothetical protein
VHKLDHGACLQANEAFWAKHPELKRRQLTNSPADAAYREEWKRLYTNAANVTPTPPPPRVSPVAGVKPPTQDQADLVAPCPNQVAAMNREKKMEEAIKRSSIWPALKDQVDLPVLIATMVATSAGLALLAATGAGAVAEAIGAGLLVLGGLAAGYQIGSGLMDLLDFFRMTQCDTARTQADLDSAARKFADGVAKTGTGGLFLILGMRGARGRTWTGKPTLDEMYGAPKDPVRIKDFEKASDGSVVRNPTINEVKPGLKLDPNKKYIWLIDQHGTMWVGEEVPVGDPLPDGYQPKLGHPTLVDGEPARIGGEIEYDPDDDSWEMNKKSGRYSAHPDRGDDQLSNAANLMRSSGTNVKTE